MRNDVCYKGEKPNEADELEFGSALEEKLKELERLKESPISSDTLSKELVQRFLQSAYTSRELLVSLIERIELTETKQIII